MFEPRHILVATDFSSFARAAADAAVALAKPFGARISLLYVLPPSALAAFARGTESGVMLDTEGFQAAVREGVRQEGGRERGRLEALGATVTFAMAEGPPAPEICAFAAEQKADLVVVGSHGRTGLARLLLGSVAENVARHAPVPVLTVRGPAE